jgi:uncharacterized membrane protein YciS (DUF1049 family)
MDSYYLLLIVFSMGAAFGALVTAWILGHLKVRAKRVSQKWIEKKLMNGEL